VRIMASDLHLHRRRYTRRTEVSKYAVISESVENVNFHWLWAAAYHENNWRRAWNWLSFYYAVKSACRSIPRPDVVIGSSPQLFAAYAARSVARRFGVPFVFEIRDLWPESLLAAGGARGLAYSLLERLAWRLYKDADRILVLARGTQSYLVDRGLPPEKFIHIPNGVDVHAVAPAPGTFVDASRTSQPFVVVYAGAHGPANGLDRVLDAAEILRPRANVHFVLVGDGPAKPQLVDEARHRGLNNVEFLDAMSKTALVEVLRRADAGLMVLRDAPLFAFAVSPNKLFDYLGAGLPVVCNVPGEVAQMVRDAGAGVQADDTSGAALATAVERLMDLSPPDRQRSGLAGRAWVMREHSREVLGDRLHHFLRGLI
jgi:glycosyltransferase involved in cell wall biosynthesis